MEVEDKQAAPVYPGNFRGFPEKVAEHVVERMHSEHCVVFSEGEVLLLKKFVREDIPTLHAFSERIQIAGNTAWVTAVGVVVVFLLGALGWGIGRSIVKP